MTPVNATWAVERKIKFWDDWNSHQELKDFLTPNLGRKVFDLSNSKRRETNFDAT